MTIPISPSSHTGPRRTGVAAAVARYVRRLDKLDTLLQWYSLQEIHFDAFVHHYLSQAGRRESDRVRRRWMEFLRWCAAPERRALLEEHHMMELAKLGKEVRMWQGVCRLATSHT